MGLHTRLLPFDDNNVFCLHIIIYKRVIMKSFLLRAITGIAVVLIIVAGILMGPYTFVGVFSVLLFGVLYEFYNLINVSREVRISKIIHSLGGVLLFVCAFLSASNLSSNKIFLLYLGYMMMLFISRIYTKLQNPIRELAYIVMGQIYIACPLCLLNSIAFHTMKYPMNERMIDYCPIFILSLFLFIWINDTGAYLTGMAFGKHKLFPSVSPKKTWEGFYGGVVFCMLLGLGLSYTWLWNLLGVDLHSGVRLSKLEWVLMGLVISIFSTYGDLIESFVKRAVGVKDSGTILPGHGGMWDRFDSLIMAAPAMIIYLIVLSLI